MRLERAQTPALPRSRDFTIFQSKQEPRDGCYYAACANIVVEDKPAQSTVMSGVPDVIVGRTRIPKNRRLNEGSLDQYS